MAEPENWRSLLFFKIDLDFLSWPESFYLDKQAEFDKDFFLLIIFTSQSLSGTFLCLLFL
jgi:hypothetical protein